MERSIRQLFAPFSTQASGGTGCRGVETVRKWHFAVVQQTIADKVIGLRMGERELVAVDLVNDLTLIGPYLTKAGAMLMAIMGR